MTLAPARRRRVAAAAIVSIAALAELPRCGQAAMQSDPAPESAPAPRPAPAQGANTNDNSTPAEAVLQTRISGQVFDELGQGVHQARVEVWRGGEDQPAGQATTNEYGDFLITLQGSRPGRYRLKASHDSFGPGEREFEVFEDDLEPFVDVFLLGALTLSGVTVESLEERPVAGATVVFQSNYRSQETVTGPDGTFKFEHLIAGDVRLLVEAEGFGRTSVDLRLLREPDAASGEVRERAEINGMQTPLPVRIVLRPEKIVHVRVVNEDDQPVEGVAVEAQLADGDYRNLISDASGQVTIDKIPYDTVRILIRLTHRDYVASGAYDQEVAVAPSPEPTRQTLRMRAAGRIRGVVRDHAGDPVNGARIDVGPRLGVGNPSTFTNRSGEFEINSLPPGQHVVTVHASGYAPELSEISVAARQDAVATLVLNPGRTITGVVRDAQGQPAAGADIEAMRWRGHQTLALYTRCGDDGQFTLSEAPADSFAIDIIAPGGVLTDQEIAAGRDRYEFTLQAAPAGSGAGFELVTARAGDACPDFELTTLAGIKLSARELRGKLVMLDFWATWCGPCVREIPTLQRIHKEFGNRADFVMISISSDFDADTLKRFLQERPLPWHHVLGSAGPGEALSSAFGVRAIPCVILVGPDGKLQSVGLAGDALIAEVSRLAGGKQSE